MTATLARLGRLTPTAPGRPLLALGLAAATLLAALGTSAQEPVEEPTAEALVEASSGWKLDPRWSGLLGTWQLMDFDHSTLLIDAEDIRGYMQVSEGFLSMVIHARNLETEDFPVRLGQGGLHRWHMVRTDILQTATVMGHSNFGLEFEWETPNTPREFRVTLVEDDLELVRPDLSRLVWRRMPASEFPAAALERADELRSGVED